MTKSDAQLYAVTGYAPKSASTARVANRYARAGFFLDSYDLFIVNLVTPIWTYECVDSYIARPSLN